MRRAAVHRRCSSASLAGAGVDRLRRRLHRAPRPRRPTRSPPATDFNTVAVTITDPGATLRGTVDAAVDRDLRARDRQRHVPDRARRHDHVDRRLHRDHGALHLRLEHGRRGRRLARPARGGRRPGRLPAHLRDRRLAPRRQHAPRRLARPTPAYLTGTETLTATGVRRRLGLASLAIYYRPAGGSWTTLCTGSTSPRTCSLNTAPLADGSYELRAPRHRRRRQRPRHRPHPHGRQHRADRSIPRARRRCAAPSGRHDRRRRHRQRRRPSPASSAPPGTGPGRRSASTSTRRTSARASTRRRPRRPLRGPARSPRTSAGFSHDERDHHRPDRQHRAGDRDARRPRLAVRAPRR